jgi:pimeloyl-ACP methyl ester carboxylesterase
MTKRLLAGLAAVAILGFGVDRAFLSGGPHYGWPPERCVVDGLNARCGTFTVPENRAVPKGRTIGLRVVVLPAYLKPGAKDAVTYLEGGPGGAATDDLAVRSEQLGLLNVQHDLLFVDQRGTGGSKRNGADVTQYGTRMAMDDLDAVRAALGYRQLDVIGSSYGATAAQVYVKLHPRSVRALVLAGGTAIDVPFFGRYAVNAQHALDDVASVCASDAGCRRAFPNWERRFGELVREWNAHPMHGTTGNDLASVVHVMLLDGTRSVSIPLVVNSAAKGDLGPLRHAGSGDLRVELNLMAKSIWCNEPWPGLDAAGPWGTAFDSYTTARIAAFRKACSSVERRAEPPALWALPVRSSVPLLALVGGADPQDPIANLAGLKKHFPDSRAVIFPHVGHSFGIGGCADEMMTELVERGTTKGLDTTRCDGAVVVPPFPLAG